MVPVTEGYSCTKAEHCTYTPALLLVAKKSTALIPQCDSGDPFTICVITEVDTTTEQTSLLLASCCLKTELLPPICLHVPVPQAGWHPTLP